MRIVNDPGPWSHGLDGALTVIDLMAAGTLPAEQAATLWWALGQGASLLTAGGPSGAGKTTLANALLPFLPPAAQVYVHAGREDPLALPSGNGPVYLLVSEFSAHGRPHYLSGPAAERAFALLRNGVRLVGTMHADSVAEAVGALRNEFGLPEGDIAQVSLVAIMRVTRGSVDRRFVRRDDSNVERRVVEIGLLAPADNGLRTTPIACWDATSEQLKAAPGAVSALAAWGGQPLDAVMAAIQGRSDVLSTLLETGHRDAEGVAAAVRDFAGQSS